MPKNYGIIGKKQETTVLSAEGIIGLNNSYHDMLNGKYPDRGSTELWVAINGAYTGQSRTFSGSVMDSSGNTYTFGRYSPDSTNDLGGLTTNYVEVPFVQKWSPEGVFLWEKFYYHYNSSDQNGPTYGYFYGAAVDPNGSYIYFIGYGNAYFTTNPQSNDVFVFKMNTSDGSMVWFKLYGSVYSSNSSPALESDVTAYRNGICCLDDNGSTRIYFIFYGSPNSTNNQDCWITEINDSGVIQTTKWIQATYCYSGSIFAKGSNIYVGVYSQYGLSGGGSYDWTLFKLITFGGGPLHKIQKPETAD